MCPSSWTMVPQTWPPATFGSAVTGPKLVSAVARFKLPGPPPELKLQRFVPPTVPAPTEPPNVLEKYAPEPVVPRVMVKFATAALAAATKVILAISDHKASAETKTAFSVALQADASVK